MQIDVFGKGHRRGDPLWSPMIWYAVRRLILVDRLIFIKNDVDHTYITPLVVKEIFEFLVDITNFAFMPNIGIQWYKYFSKHLSLFRQCYIHNIWYNLRWCCNRKWFYLSDLRQSCIRVFQTSCQWNHIGKYSSKSWFRVLIAKQSQL